VLGLQILVLNVRSETEIRTAFASMAWKTGPSSPGDKLMTLSTSDAANRAVGGKAPQGGGGQTECASAQGKGSRYRSGEHRLA
jgi:hypothetical protein